MSNYPPGVTGREYAISGPSSEKDESIEVGECRKLDQHVISYVIGNWSGYDYAPGTYAKVWRGKHRRAQSILCTFAGGEVNGVLYDHVDFSWNCPVCHTDNETELEPPEPPEYDPSDLWD